MAAISQSIAFPGFSTRVSHHLLTTIKTKATKYMASHPGSYNFHGNSSYHGPINQVIAGDGDSWEFSKLRRLNDVLNYRISTMQLAEHYCKQLQLQLNTKHHLPSSADFDVESWEHSLYLEASHKNINRQRRGLVFLNRYSLIRRWLIYAFPAPAGDEGTHFYKPRAYLAAMLARSNLTEKQIRQKLEELKG